MARPCPISEEHFEKHATEIVLRGEHNGEPIEITLDPRADKAGKSLGWTAGSLRFTMKIGGVETPMIGSVNLSCIGSKKR